MRRLFLALAALALWLAPAAAQEWPTRPVTIIAPAAPGSAPDLVTRLIVNVLQTAIGRSFVAVNRPGAGGNIGTQAIARADADGYTFGVTLPGPLVVNPMMMDVGYRATDVTAVSLLGSQPSVLFVNAAIHATSLAELVAWIRAEPKPVQYAISGIGSGTHLVMEAFRQEYGLQLEYVAYNGSNEAAQATGQGEVKLAVMPALMAASLAEQGRGRMLAVSSLERWASLPHVPSFAEAGMRGFQAIVWTGLVGPARVPPAIVGRLAETLRTEMAKPEIREQMRRLQFDVVASTPQEFAAILRDEEARWRPVLTRAGLLKQ